jgi:hypothetical protein
MKAGDFVDSFPMHAIATVFVRILEGIFAVGVLGSALVVVLTLIEDMKSLLENEKSPEIPR